jgi:nucleoid DNA-binding protein
MALTKDKIVDALVKEFNLQRREAVDFVDTFFDTLKADVTSGERVKLAGFGSFYLPKKYYHRKRRDIPVCDDTPRWRIPSFTPSAALKARVQRATREERKDVD